MLVSRLDGGLRRVDRDHGGGTVVVAAGGTGVRRGLRCALEDRCAGVGVGDGEVAGLCVGVVRGLEKVVGGLEAGVAAAEDAAVAVVVGAAADAVVADDVARSDLVVPVGLDVVADPGVGDDVVLDHVVGRGVRAGTADDHAGAVAIDDVAGDERALGVRVELDAAVGVVVDVVVADDDVVGGGDVDAMVVVGGGHPAAVVNAVVLDDCAVGAAVGVEAAERDADVGVVVGDVVSGEGHVHPVDRRARLVGSVATVEVQVGDGAARGLLGDPEATGQRGALAGVAGQRHLGGGDLDLVVRAVGAAAEAARLARSEGVDERLSCLQGLIHGAGGGVRAVRSGNHVAVDGGGGAACHRDPGGGSGDPGERDPGGDAR